jgi:hypothetical protein
MSRTLSTYAAMKIPESKEKDPDVPGSAGEGYPSGINL